MDGTIGSDPGVAAELYRPIGSTPLFVAPYAGIGTMTFNLIQDDAVIARYSQTVSRLGLNVGVNLGARSDLRDRRLRRALDGIDRGGRPRLSGAARQGNRAPRLRVATRHPG